ncbi:MAG: hypothetical protein VX070_01835 [Bacteroidota bacterium]|nr:hypothetical protein [Bacteroidota bacterium]
MTNSVDIQTTPPFEFLEAPYFQSWLAGVRGGGSGINVFIPYRNLNSITLDSLHFRGQRAAVIFEGQNIIARFKTLQNQGSVVVLSSDPLMDAKNLLLPMAERSPFELDAADCVLSYTADNKRHYYKVEGLKERPSIVFPSAAERE